jgi:hypothetical protein
MRHPSFPVRVRVLALSAILFLGCSDSSSVPRSPNEDILTAIAARQYTRVDLQIDSLDVLWTEASLRQDNPFCYRQTYNSSLDIPRRFEKNTLDLKPSAINGFSDVGVYVQLLSKDVLTFSLHSSGQGVSSGATEHIAFTAPYTFDSATGAIHVTDIPATILSESFIYKYYRWDKNRSNSDEVIGIDPAEDNAHVALLILGE